MILRLSMREAIRDIDRLCHIEESIKHVMDFLKGKTYEETEAEITHILTRKRHASSFAFSLPLNESFSHRRSRLPEQETQLSCHKRDQEMYS